jgi:polymorphic membrane protein
VKDKNNLFKKLLIPCMILLLFFVALSGVNATTDIYINSTNNTISEAIDDADPNDVIYLANGTYDYTNHIKNPNGVTINKNLTIIGEDPKTTIIDAQRNGKIFNIAAGNTVTLINITIINGYSNSEGGAIYNSGTLILKDSIFANNTATFGGAIINYGDNFIVINSTFTNNTAIDASGGIFNFGDNFIVINSTFTNNTASDAGAIFNDGDNFIVINSTFTNNTASNDGGAIGNVGGSFSMINSTFTNNKANNAGGVIWNDGDGMSIIGCDIVDNTKAIYTNSDNVVINYNRIFNNKDYDLNDIGVNTNADYNWWGSNYPDMSKIIGINPNNHFVMDVTNSTSLDSNGTVTFDYIFRLNTGESADNNLLPYFVTEVYTDLTSGVVTSFDARYDKIFSVTVNTSGNIEYRFATDNELQILEGIATIPDPIDPYNPIDPVNLEDPDDPVDPIDPEDAVDPIEPADPVDPVDPADNTNTTKNQITASATMKKTGIPINLILLVLLSILGFGYYRKQ